MCTTWTSGLFDVPFCERKSFKVIHILVTNHLHSLLHSADKIPRNVATFAEPKILFRRILNVNQIYISLPLSSPIIKEKEREETWTICLVIFYLFKIVYSMLHNFVQVVSNVGRYMIGSWCTYLHERSWLEIRDMGFDIFCFLMTQKFQNTNPVWCQE